MVLDGVIQLLVYELARIPILRNRVNKAKGIPPQGTEAYTKALTQQGSCFMASDNTYPLKPAKERNASVMYYRDISGSWSTVLSACAVQAAMQDALRIRSVFLVAPVGDIQSCIFD